MANLVIDWNSGFETGMGYNTATGQLCRIRVVNVSPDPNEPSSTVSPSSKSSLVESDDSFAQAMNFSASLGASYCGIGMSASASFMMSMNMNRKTSAVVKYIYWKDDHPTNVYTMADTKLNAYALDVLEQQGPAEFYQQFGDCFIGGFHKGGECFAGYRMEFSSVEERNEAKASIEASYTATSGSASFEANLDSRKVHCSKELTWYSVGYPSGKLPATDGTWAEAVEFMSNIDTKLGNKVQAVLAKYQDLNSYARAVERYKEKHPNAPSFAVPDSALPGIELVKDFNEMYSRLSYVGSQLAHTVKIGLTYDNPGDVERQKCLVQINAFQDNILRKLSPGDLMKAEETNSDPASRFRELQREGERFWKAGQKALKNPDGTVIELWNTPANPYPAKRGDTRVSLEGFGKGAGLVLYSAGPKAGAAPGPPPIQFGTDIDLASKFKIWVADGDYFTLQVLGVRDDKPIFIGLGLNWTEWFEPYRVPMRQLEAKYDKAETFHDGGFDGYWCLKRKDAGNGMVFLTTWEDDPPASQHREGPFHIRIAPPVGDWTPAGVWTPVGNEVTSYWMVGLRLHGNENSRTPPPEWFTDDNTRWQIRIVDDPAGASGSASV